MPLEFIVKANTEPQKVVVSFATTIKDLSFVDRWRETLGAAPEFIQRDAVDLAVLARERLIADSCVGQTYIAKPEDMCEQIAHDPCCEVAGLMVLRCDWFPHSDVIGISHFRRTWCNNIVLDYLATHPLILGPSFDNKYRIRGTGQALLCSLSRIAVANSCDYIWGEATQISCTYYKKQFDLKEVKDLFKIPQPHFTKYANLDLDWQRDLDVNIMKVEALHDLYEVEEISSPLIGKGSIMIDPKRQLVNHFLDLQRHVQNEIAQILGLLQEGDIDIMEDQWCAVLFQRANQSGKIGELWNEVEKRHENGEPDKNPFVN
jgi:hypothetical protein